MKGEMGPLKVIIVAVIAMVCMVGVLYLAVPGLFITGTVTGVSSGGDAVSTGEGKLELMQVDDPVFCAPSGEVGADKTGYTATCQDVSSTAAESIDLSKAPTEDVVAGPARFTLQNSGDGTVSGIKVDVYSSDPNKVTGYITTGKSGWNEATMTLQQLSAKDSVTFDIKCKYEGGQLDANERVDLSFTGVATSGAKSGYKTFKADLNCTA